jgi:glycine cleavage system aminomethyltransferase T
MERLTVTFEGRELAFEPADTVLEALLRNGERPTPGGTLCLAGDCPNCVATVDGVAYVRTCQTPAVDGLNVEPHPKEGVPALPTTPPPGDGVTIEHRHADAVVIGGGTSGLAAAAEHEAAGRSALVIDADDGTEAIGLYQGPRVVARTPAGMVSISCDEIVVATGAGEVQPIVPGSDLAGIVTPTAAHRLAERGIDLGRVVHVGDEVVRFEGQSTIDAVVVRREDGEERIEGDTFVVDLGRYPRDGLARMGAGMPVTTVGSAASEPTLPVCPPAGTICPCAGVTVQQLDDVWERGFRKMELVKRATLAGTGTCQGAVCTPYLRGYIAAKGPAPEPAFTARPVARQVTMEEAGAGEFLPAVARTALDPVHRALGATMDRFGGWWRPWTYGDTDAEYDAVRSGVSIGDVSTLGKLTLTGPDAAATVQLLYPTNVDTIRSGQCRYALLLDERGYLLDDGMICREAEDRFTLTFTTGGASLAEMWIRDWAESWTHDVRMLSRTAMTGVINVTGPLARQLLDAAGVAELPGYLRHLASEVAGIPCTVMRLGFTGEVAYELHHPADRSVELWETLMDIGQPLGVAPHGIEALLRLRLDKGHLLVGQDTDFDSTPRRLGHEWAVDMDSGDFIGRRALTRTDRLQADKRLVGLVTRDTAPLEGAVIWDVHDYSGYVTSAAWSRSLGQGVALGWVAYRDGKLPRTVTIDGVEARRTSLPFYDPAGVRSRA